MFVLIIGVMSNIIPELNIFCCAGREIRTGQWSVLDLYLCYSGCTTWLCCVHIKHK